METNWAVLLYVFLFLTFYGAAFSGVMDDLFRYINRRFPGKPDDR